MDYFKLIVDKLNERFLSSYVSNYQLIRAGLVIVVEVTRIFTHIKEIQSQTKNTITAYQGYLDIFSQRHLMLLSRLLLKELGLISQLVLLVLLMTAAQNQCSFYYDYA